MKLFAIAGLLTLFAAPAHSATYELTDLGALRSGAIAWCNAINRHAEVVGTSVAKGGAYHAFLWREGVMEDLGTLGGPSSVAQAVNDRGDVVGAADSVSGRHAFIYRGHQLKDLGTLGGTTSFAWSINRLGHVVGEAQAADGHTEAFLYRDGAMTGLGTLGGTYSAAGGINDAGQITGIASKADGSYRAFLYADGVMNDLGALNGINSGGNAINAAGEIAGYYEIDAFDYRAFLYSGGTMHPLGGLPNRLRCVAYGINNKSLVVGECDGNAKAVGFLYRNGQMIDLNSKLDPISGAGWTFRGARAINSAGQIVGWGNLTGNNAHAILLTPMKP